jgi:hypothetical protein
MMVGMMTDAGGGEVVAIGIVAVNRSSPGDVHLNTLLSVLSAQRAT